MEAVLDSAEGFELDLRQCPLMDSAGVACLVALHRKLKKTGKPFALLVSSGQVEETLILTKLNRLYEVRLS